jgi:hypothetical protein
METNQWGEARAQELLSRSFLRTLTVSSFSTTALLALLLPLPDFARLLWLHWRLRNCCLTAVDYQFFLQACAESATPLFGAFSASDATDQGVSGSTRPIRRPCPPTSSIFRRAFCGASTVVIAC